MRKILIVLGVSVLAIVVKVFYVEDDIPFVSTKKGFERLEDNVIEFSDITIYISDDGLKFFAPFKLRMTFMSDENRVYFILKELDYLKVEEQITGKLSYFNLLDKWGNLVYSFKQVNPKSNKGAGNVQLLEVKGDYIIQQSHKQSVGETGFSIRTKRGYIQNIDSKLWSRIENIEPFSFSPPLTRMDAMIYSKIEEYDPFLLDKNPAELIDFNEMNSKRSLLDLTLTNFFNQNLKF